jgi:hypothetical protein
MSKCIYAKLVNTGDNLFDPVYENAGVDNTYQIWQTSKGSPRNRSRSVFQLAIEHVHRRDWTLRDRFEFSLISRMFDT